MDPAETKPSNDIFLNRLHPEDRETVTRIHVESAEHGTAYSIVYRLCMPGGEIKWIQENGHAEWVGPTRQQMNYGVAQDITRRKLLEEDLIVSLRLAEEANQAKSSFLASMSHELRTPLNAILGFAEMIQLEYFGPVGDPKYTDYARDIGRSGYYLLDLINDLLDISKIEAGAYHLKLEPVILRDIAAECLELIRHQADEKNLTLSNNIPPDLPLLHLDRRAIKQIILNLLGNAVKFTPDQGRVVLTGHSGADHTSFAVEDTGPGISEDVMPYLFQPFKTAMISNPVGMEGTGLGLTITKALVEMHNGTLFLSSRPDIGTSASVRLPRQDAYTAA